MVTELKLPNNYRLIEEEMMYTESGWSWDMAYNNARGLANKSSGFGYAWRASGAAAGMAGFMAAYGGLMGTLQAVSWAIPGIGWLAGAGAATFGWSLGTFRMFY